MKIKIKCPKCNKVTIGIVDIDTYNAYEKEDLIWMFSEVTVKCEECKNIIWKEKIKSAKPL